MMLSKGLSFRAILISGGWLLAVVGLVRLGGGSIELWNRRTEELRTAQERLSRIHGWLSVEQEVEAREKGLLGPLALADKSGLIWSCLEGLQALAGEQGISLEELRPSESAGEGRRAPGSIRLDMRLEGGLEKMGQFLQRIPDKMPGVRLESMQFLPQEKGQVQGVLRLSLPAWEQS